MADVIFPDEENNHLTRNYDDEYVFENESGAENAPSLHHPPECAALGSTYCETVDEYPAQYIMSIMNRTDCKQMLENDNSSATPGRFDMRFSSPLLTEITLCSTITTTIYPKLAQTVNYRWNYIVNQAEFVQGISVELCVRHNRCNFAHRLPIGYKTNCRQMYREKRLLGIDARGNVQQSFFRLPSHCECTIKWTDWY